MSRESSPYAITPLKLQKLLYYAQGFYLRNNEQPLFDEDLIAMDYGPVNLEVYEKYKKHKYRTIPDKPFVDKEKLTHEERMAIIEAWNEFGDLDGKTLEELTQQEDPWLFTPKDQVIEVKLISKYFREQLDSG